MVSRFNLFIATGSIVAGLALAPLGAQGRSRDHDGVPNLDVKGSCSDAQRFSTGTSDKDVAFKGCMQDEMNAKTELGKRWGEFKAKDKQDCVEQSRVPSPSYVEVLTCLEMDTDTAKGAPKLKPSPPSGAPGATPGPVPGGPMPSGPMPRT